MVRELVNLLPTHLDQFCEEKPMKSKLSSLLAIFVTVALSSARAKGGDHLRQ
jgi:hypothetical protein